MLPPTEAEIRGILGPHEKDILAVVHGAWQDFQDLGLSGRLRYKRNRAGLVHDFMVQRGMGLWGEGSGVTWQEKDETAKFIFAEKVVVRFKKADENGLGSNIMTQAVMAFVDPQMELPGIPSVSKVEVVYALNAFETQIETVAVVSRDGDQELWSYVIDDLGGAAVIPLPLAPTPTEPDVVITPKALPEKPKKTG
ncbi:hypothetical protein RLW55_01395 [Hyphomicrobium sp. B1]|uniref:hypothetical protein n=1 Tax=Hyphomicrobium sp. B1 TaxID=3075651 RepID=UPI003C2AD63F